MKPTQELHDKGQSLWLDNITRTMLDDGTLAGYIDELSVTGLTSNPTIFDKAIGEGNAYDDQVAELTEQGLEGEEMFFELAITDLRRAAELFRPVHERTDGSTGASRSRSRRCSPTTTRRRSSRPPSSTAAAEENFFIKIPGTIAGQTAIEETIFAGIPVNVTLLFSTEQYLGAAEAYMRGIERRVEAGLNPDVASVASLFISRWDAAVADEAPDELRNKLGIAVGKQYLRRLPRAARLRSCAAARETRARGPAAALGEHRDQGPRRLRRPLHRGSRLAVHGQHDAREDAARPSPTTARSASCCRSTAATPRRRSRRSTTPASTPTRSPRSCRTTAPTRSSSSWNELLETISKQREAVA